MVKIDTEPREEMNIHNFCRRDYIHGSLPHSTAKMHRDLKKR